MKYGKLISGLLCSLWLLASPVFAAAEIPSAVPPPKQVQTLPDTAGQPASSAGTESAETEIVETFSSPLEAATAIERELQTGSLVFTRGDCLAVRIYTHSPYTHVAAVVKENNHTYVYDSTNPVGVRKLLLTEYLATQLPDELHLLHPVHTLTKPQQDAFRLALQEKIGTPYSVKHYLTGNRAQGVHCAEYVTDALAECQLMHAENPPGVSPASLLEGGIRAGLYQPVRSFAIQIPASPSAQGDNWCEQLWIDTKRGTLYCTRKMSKLFLCR